MSFSIRSHRNPVAVLQSTVGSLAILTAIAVAGCSSVSRDEARAEFNQEGVEQLQLGQYEEAIASFDSAIEIEPDDYDAWLNRGFALENLGHYNAATGSYARAIEIQPERGEAWFSRGESLMALNYHVSEIVER